MDGQLMSGIRTLVATVGLLSVATAGTELVVMAMTRSAVVSENARIKTLKTDLLRTSNGPNRSETAAGADGQRSSQSISARPALDLAVRAFVERVQRAKTWFVQNPAQAIPEMRTLTEKEWNEKLLNADLSTPKGVRKMAASLRGVAMADFGGRALKPALGKYVAAHDGQLPHDISQLTALLPDAGDAPALARYTMVLAGSAHSPAAENFAIALKPDAVIDNQFDWMATLGTAGSSIGISSLDGGDALLYLATIRAEASYAMSHDGVVMWDEATLLPYYANPVDGHRAFAEEQVRMQRRR